MVTLFFVARDPDHGNELWRSDGTSAGSGMVRDIALGDEGSDPGELTAMGGTLYFGAYDPTHGYELWKSDGTSDGTEIVRELAAGDDSGQPSGLTAIDGTLYFSAYDDAGGTELWKTDGTSAGTVQVRDIADASSDPFNLAAFGDRLVFSADDGTNGRELWVSDGTSDGTVLVADISAGPPGGEPSGFTVVGETLFFRANRPDTGEELWAWDGKGLPALMADIAPGPAGSVTQGLVDFGGTLFFVAHDNSHGLELWKSDGTSPGTELVRDLGPGDLGDQSVYPPLLPMDGTLYFLATDGTGSADLWRSDGTSEGTERVIDLLPGRMQEGASGLYEEAGTLYFTLPGTAGDELWRSDGTSAGTGLAADIWPGPQGSAPTALYGADGTLFFRAEDPAGGRELWMLGKDGLSTIDLLPGLEPRVSAWDLEFFAKAGGAVVMAVQGPGNSGRELWSVDGTTDGTVLVRDIRPGSTESYMADPVDLGGTLVFTADEDIDGRQLWKSDGTSAGTVRLTGFLPDLDHDPDDLAVLGGHVYFSAGDPTHGRELWRTDGTSEGTELVVDIWDGPDSARPRDLFVLGGTLYFHAEDPVHADQLWASDGTSAGTRLVSTIDPDDDTEFDDEPFAAAGGKLFVLADDGDHGTELWVSDGTSDGTKLTRDIRPGDASSEIGSRIDFGGTLYFSANDGTRGSELWRSDGTSAGTSIVRDIRTGSSSAAPSRLIVVDDTLYFRATGDGSLGSELWKSDGTSGGTLLVRDIRAGSSSSSPEDLVDLNGTLYFTATDGSTGIELWKSDGTSDGTVLVRDIRPGSSSGEPVNLNVIDGTLYFFAEDGTNGLELWRSDGTSDGTVRLTGYADPASSEPLDFVAMGEPEPPPATPDAPDLIAASDSGRSATDNLTKDTTPTFTGEGTDGAAVVLYDGEDSVGAATVVGGDWTITATTLTEGVHTITAEFDGTLQSDALLVTIDTTTPETTVDAGPAEVTKETTATFDFGPDETGITFSARLDGGTPVEVDDTLDLAGLTHGTHTLVVYATDAAGNVETTPVTYDWTVDTKAPQTTIEDAPSTLTNQTTATFDFGPDEVGITFVTKLDSDPTSSNAGALELSSVAEGKHTLVVYAVDEAGNKDATPETFVWTVDTTPPDTTILDGPDPVTNQSTAFFDFGSNEAGVDFWAALDGGAYSAVNDPESFTGLGDGAHSLAVYVVDRAGNMDPTPAEYVWTIDGAPPLAPTVDAFADDTGEVGDGATSDRTLRVNGTAEASVTVHVLRDGKEVGTATVSGGGTWSYTDPTTLAFGHHEYEAYASDGVNDSGLSDPLDVLVADSKASAGNGGDLILGGSGTGNIDGKEGNDTIFGEAGNDTVKGGNGQDWLSGGGDADALWGGNGNDTALGGSGRDTIFGENGDDVIDGGEGDDRLDGGAGSDVIDGGAGADTIVGGDGPDTISAGAGADRISGEAGSDYVILGDDDAKDTILGSIAHLSGDTLVGFETGKAGDVVAITGLNAATQGKLLDSLAIIDGVLSLSKIGGGTIFFADLEGTHYTDTVLGSDGSILLYVV